MWNAKCVSHFLVEYLEVLQYVVGIRLFAVFAASCI